MTDASFLKACKQIDTQAENIVLYHGEQALQVQTNLPFLISSEPMYIPPEYVHALEVLGPVLVKYFKKVAEIRGESPRYIFLRPDILFTEEGLKICEVETSVFGFALGVFLSTHVSTEGMLGNARLAVETFCKRWEEYTGQRNGSFVYSDHSALFIGQLLHLADMCQEIGFQMNVKHVQEAQRLGVKSPLYRCFYRHERKSDYRVSQLSKTHPMLLPSGSDIYDGKHMLVLWRSFARDLMSESERKILDQFFLPTWLLTPHMAKDFVLPLENWLDLAELPKSQRKFVVKRVGEHPDASWSRSVSFLHKRTKKEVRHILQRALLEPGEWVIQQFFGNKKYTIAHADHALQEKKILKGRVRITPYYDFKTGKLLIAKATIRSDTLFIHGATDSVNTVLAESSSAYEKNTL